jgi:hypothetical protein
MFMPMQSRYYSTLALYMNVFECFCILLLSSGFIFAGVFITDKDDQDPWATKYISVGHAFALLFIGLTIPTSIMYKTLVMVDSQPKVAQACTSISLPRVRS